MVEFGADRFCKQIRTLLICALALLWTAPASATAVKQAPWHPQAAAYLATLFLAELAPVPWQKIEAAWTEPYPDAASDTPAFQLLAERPDGEASVAAIRAAIADQQPQALFAATTRATANALLHELSKAAENLPDGDAGAPLAAARELYRAFEAGIAAADPQAARELGLSWLEMTSSAGSRGVLGAGVLQADTSRFMVARQRIADYIRANYAPETFTARSRFAPLPETTVAAGEEPMLRPQLPPGSRVFDQAPLPRLVLNFEQQGIHEADLPLVAYGDMLFDSPLVFGSPARDVGMACSTCHNRSDINNSLFIPGVSHQAGAVDVDGAFFNPMFNDQRDDPIDIPSLRGLRFTGPYGRDGRFGSLRDFTRNVMVNEFGGAEPSPFMLDALVAYLMEFDFLPNAKIGRMGRLTDAASEAAHRGEVLFRKPFPEMDGRSCASCHVPSANFLDRQAHDIGSVSEAYRGARAGAMDTPTLLGARFTAPYFHDGSLPTLASVVDWFNQSFALDLTEAERSDLTAYLEAVGDADEPHEAFDDRNTSFRMVFTELTTFASTLDVLIPRQDAKHALLLIDTVATDLSADAGTMSNLDARPELYRLAETLAAVGKAIKADDWSEAQSLWDEFKGQQAKISENMF